MATAGPPGALATYGAKWGAPTAEATPDQKQQQKNKDESPPPIEKPKTSAQEAGRINNQYMKVVCVAMVVARLARSRPEWAWAYNDVTLTPMLSAQNAVEQAIADKAVLSRYINTEIAELRRQPDFEDKAKEFQVVLSPSWLAWICRSMY